MEEYSRILIEEYCESHHSARSRRLARLVEMSYDLNVIASDEDAIFLEMVIEREKNPELRKALEDLDEFLFGY